MPSTGMLKLLFSFSVGTTCRYVAMLILKVTQQMTNRAAQLSNET